MKNVLSKTLEEYCSSLSTQSGDALNAIERYTYTQMLKPQMSTDSWQGSFLTMVSQIMSPKYILELGTFTGYSTLCLAKGLSSDGKLITLEVNAETLAKTKAQFQSIPEFNKIEFLNGAALELIPTLPNDIDLIYIDAKKDEYHDYYESLVPKLRAGGILIVDNILWYGKIVDSDKDKTTQLIHDFNVRVFNDSRVDNCILPIRDGLQFIRKH